MTGTRRKKGNRFDLPWKAIAAFLSEKGIGETYISIEVSEHYTPQQIELIKGALNAWQRLVGNEDGVIRLVCVDRILKIKREAGNIFVTVDYEPFNGTVIEKPYVPPEPVVEKLGFKYNRDQARRDAIIGDSYCPMDPRDDDLTDREKAHLSRSFSGLTLAQLELLFAERFIDPEDNQNVAPTAKEIFEFMWKYPKVRAHGYSISLVRDDYRVSLEGIHYRGPVSEEMKKDFKTLFQRADEKRCRKNELSCWYD
jgi:hypothetical protein